MPCNCDHMEPTVAERQKQQAAGILVYLNNELGHPNSPELLEAERDIYGGKIHPENVVKMLCERFRNMTQSQMNHIVYDGRNPKARRAADWWDEHKAEDAKREAIEFRQEMEAKYPNHVFIVMRNADMTEGRGPMVFDRVYGDITRALNYIENTRGVMGGRTGLRHHVNNTTGVDEWSANDHTMKPVKIQ